MSKRTFILGTAGHIDHGKPSLVRALTGIDTDRLPEEKSRGITIDIGFANLDLGDTRIGIVDVPGHEGFIRNMLAGATGIDLAMLIVAADDGVMPQTREHLAILQLLNIRHGLIVLTKTDLVEDSWVELVEEDVRSLVRDTFLQDAPIVRASAQTGAGIEDVRSAIAEVCGSIEGRAPSDCFRLAVDRSFTAPGIGTIITGSVACGALRVGEEIEWLPAGKSVRVRGLQSHGRDVAEVNRSQRTAVNLIGVHHSEIIRGHELATPGWLKPSRLLTVHLRLLDTAPWPLRHRARVRLHLGTQELIAGVRLLGANQLEPGRECFAQIACAQPAVAYAGEPFVIRAESPLVTLGGGHIVQPVARPIRRRDAQEVAPRLERLLRGDDEVRVSEAIAFFGVKPCTNLDLARDASVELSQVDSIFQHLTSRGEIIEMSSSTGQVMRVHRDALAALEGRIAAATARLHEEFPLESAVPRQRLVQRLSRTIDAVIITAAVHRMIVAKRLRGDGQSIALPSFKPKLTVAQQALLTRMIDLYDRAEFNPPDVGEMAKEVGASEKEVRTVLDLAVKAGKVMHLGGPLYMHVKHEAELRRRTEETLRQRGEITMSDLRDLFSTTRKYAVPMGEYLDKIGLTKRKGDYRVLAGQ